MNEVDAGGARISGMASRERRRQGAHRPRQCGGAFQIIKRVEGPGPAQECRLGDRLHENYSVVLQHDP
jgi:hypothetical protein